METTIRSISLVLIRRASSALAKGMDLNRSRALVMVPVQPALDLLTAARSTGGLLLEDMVPGEEMKNRVVRMNCLSQLRKDLNE